MLLPYIERLGNQTRLPWHVLADGSGGIANPGDIQKITSVLISGKNARMIWCFLCPNGSLRSLGSNKSYISPRYTASVWVLGLQAQQSTLSKIEHNVIDLWLLLVTLAKGSIHKAPCAYNVPLPRSAFLFGLATETPRANQQCQSLTCDSTLSLHDCTPTAGGTYLCNTEVHYLNLHYARPT